jgi:hypothetical protein
VAVAKLQGRELVKMSATLRETTIAVIDELVAALEAAH